MRFLGTRLSLLAMGICIVTGANRGIGLSLCKLLAQKGKSVVGVCRKSSEGLDNLGVEVVSGVDVTSSEGVSKMSELIGNREVELLINNAGILVGGDTVDQVDLDGMMRQFDVNAVGPVRVTQAVLPRLAPGSKIAFITSRMGSMADNGSGGHYGYRMSKAALNAAAVSFARDLRDKQIAVAILHPGMVSTDMIGGRGQVEPDDSAAGLLERISELNLETSGGFWHQNGEVLPW